MSNRKVIGPEYKDEYKRKHRSKFLSEDMETREKFGVFKVPDLFKPEHKKAFKDLYNYNDDVIKENKLPDEIEEEQEEIKATPEKISEAKVDEGEEGEEDQIGEEEKEVIQEENKEGGEDKLDQEIKQTFIDIFNPRLQLEAQKELEVEFYIKKGSKTDQALKNIISGDDAVQFFAVQGNSTPCKFFFCEKVQHKEEWKFTPYDLVVIPKDKRKSDYFIITSSGINHVYEVHNNTGKLKNINQQAEYFTLRDWMYQSTQFNILRHIKYFNQYLPFKLFEMWRNYTAFKKFQATRETLSKSLFMTKPAFVEKAIEINQKINSLITKRIEGVVNEAKPWQTPGLTDFQGAQSDVFEKAKTEFRKTISEKVFDTLKELYRSLSTRLKEVREIDETENSKTLQELKNKSMYNLKQETKKRKELIQLADFDVAEFDKFITMADFMVVEKLYELIKYSLKKINGQLEVVQQNQAYFVLDLNFVPIVPGEPKQEDNIYDGKGVILSPGQNIIQEKFEDLFRGMVEACTMAPRLSSFFPQKNYEQILQMDASNNDKNNIDGEHVNINSFEPSEISTEKKNIFEKIIKESEYYPKYTAKIQNKLKKDFDFIFTKSQEDYENFKSLCEDYDSYENKKDEGEEEEQKTDEIGRKLELCNSRMKDLENKIISNYIINNNTMIRNCEPLINRYTVFIRGTQAKLKERLEEIFKQNFFQSEKYLEEGNKLFTDERKTSKEICQFIKRKNQYEPTRLKLESNIKEMSQMLITMKAFRLSSDEMNKFKSRITDPYDKLDKDIKSAEEEIKNNKTGTLSKIKDDIDKTKADIEQLTDDINKSVLYSTPTDDEATENEVLKKLEEDYELIKKNKQKMDEYNDNLKTLEEAEDDRIITAWQELNEKFEIKKGLWDNLTTLKKKWEEWQKKTIAEFLAADPPITTQIEDFNMAIDNLDSKLGRIETDKILNKLKKLNDEVFKYLPVIQILSSSAMEDRHWKEFFQVLRLEGEIDCPYKSVTLEKIKEERPNEPSVIDCIDDIENILASATAQRKILNDIQTIESDWKEINFQLINQSKIKNEIKYIIATVEEIYTKLDQDSNTITADLASRHVKDIKDKVVYWDDLLNSIASIIEEWLFVQKQWIYLENIFSAEDIQKQLPKASQDFKSVNKEFKDLMKNTHDHPCVIEVCKNEKLLPNLMRYHRNLDTVQKSLEDYLQTKRKAFPRFYFLSNDELLKILSNTRQPRLVNDYLSKCFDGIKQVNFVSETSNEIIQMVSPENEVVDLSETLLATQNIEGWLNDLERSMLLTVYDKTKLCLEKYPPFKEPRREWVYAGFPCQSVITIDQVKWAEFVETTLDNIKKGDSLQNFFDYMESLILELTTMVKEKTQKLKKSLTERLILINVHAREVVRNMMNKNVENVNDFEWQKNLKFYWEKEVDVTGENEPRLEVIIRQTNSRFVYGYEYLGNP
ncbi:MAG: hypothetical protein MJ252_00015 [archaeon]|nr:hypothetical protein [archaeon]